MFSAMEADGEAGPGKAPKVSVITSTYNRAEIVKRGIQSVVDQAYTDWEMCVVGDCTPDHTGEVVRAFGDERLRFCNLPEKSPPGSHGAIAKNHALLEMARGTYIAYLDDDDRYRPNHLSTMVGFLESNPDAVFAYCRCAYRDRKTGRRIRGNPFQRWMHGHDPEKLKRYNYIDTDCVVHTRALLDVTGAWDPDFYFDDYEFFLRVSASYPLHHVNRVLVDKFVEEPPFLKRAVTKGWGILRHGRHTPVE